MENFTPTYLMVKQHRLTGMKYFCKTISKKFIRYKGSGIFWNRHINKHGRDYIDTIWYELFYNKEDLVEFATFFSEELDIVNSKDWANLIVEDGLTGFLSENSKSIQHNRIEDGTHHLLSGDIQRDYQNSKVEDGTHRWLSGEEQRLVQRKLIENGIHRFCDSNYQSMVSKMGNNKRMKDGSHNIIQYHTCPHCGKKGKGIVMFRHHFDNCKKRY